MGIGNTRGPEGMPRSAEAALGRLVLADGRRGGGVRGDAGAEGGGEDK